jgi:hypothetical protein
MSHRSATRRFLQTSPLLAIAATNEPALFLLAPTCETQELIQPRTESYEANNRYFPTTSD